MGAARAARAAAASASASGAPGCVAGEMEEGVMAEEKPAEVGRELAAGELPARLRTVVVLHVHDRPYITAWVRQICSDHVHFYAGEIRTEFIAHRFGEALADDAGRLVRVFVWLDPAQATRLYG